MQGDMLVNLYNLPSGTGEEALAGQGIRIMRALAPDLERITDWVRREFNVSWAGECRAAFSNRPISCFVAARGGRPVGFACYDATAPDFFGPTGVDPACRGLGVGRALLLRCLYAMREQGYVYAVIGGVEEAVGFYEKTVGAVPIPDSHPGVYARMIGWQDTESQ